MKRLKDILFFTILGAMLFTVLQSRYSYIEEKPLSGAYNLPDTVPLTVDNWFSGKFQNLYSPFYEYQIGFRPSFIRLNNQLNYWMYHKSTNYVVIGKEKQLFAWNYWAPFNGLYYIGKDSINTKVETILRLKERLDAEGVPLMVIIGANKARYMPEYLPDNYVKVEQKPNNYRDFLEGLQSTGIKLVDFNEVVLKMKPEVGKIMFPNSGTHWSAYCMGLCLDSITSYANRMNADTLKVANVEGYFRSDSIVNSDVDLANDLNLFFPWEQQTNLFASIAVEPKGRKAKLFVVGDSFYWNLYQLDAFYEVVDSSSHYWYYNNTDISFDSSRRSVEEFDAHALVSESDLVVLIATEANLNSFPFGFAKEFLKN